jgi:predicted enzyme related to lactoylglutathione lyase
MGDSDGAAVTAKIVWFEMPSRDTARAREFYTGLFGWSFEPFAGMDYHMAGEAGGAVYSDSEARGITAYFGVLDVEQAAKQVTELGGKAGERQEIPGVGFYVQCEDLDGNRFGIYQEVAG